MGTIRVIPIEDTFLRIFDKPPKVRLSRQVIEFNYAHLSPFRNGGHIACQTDSSILVWYLKQPLSTDNLICIPEAYQVWRFFRDRSNAIILLPRAGKVSLLVIAGGDLRAQLQLSQGEAFDQKLDLLKREFSLQNIETIRLEPTASFSLKPADILAFANFDLNPSNLLTKVVALCKAPLIAALFISACFTIYQSTQMEAVYAEKSKRLAILKRENAAMQSSLDQVREQSAYWRSFIAKEQEYPDFYQILSGITDVVKRHGGYLNMVELNENRLTIWTGLKSSESAIIKDLLATGMFKEVKLLSSSKDSSKQEFNLYNLAITLQPASPGGKS